MDRSVPYITGDPLGMNEVNKKDGEQKLTIQYFVIN